EMLTRSLRGLTRRKPYHGPTASETQPERRDRRLGRPRERGRGRGRDVVDLRCEPLRVRDLAAETLELTRKRGAKLEQTRVGLPGIAALAHRLAQEALDLR